MRLLDPDEFLAWAAERHIGLDERYEEPRCLVYRPYRTIRRFWAVPESVNAGPEFLGSLLDGLGPWTSCRLWFRGGCWPDHAKHEHTDTHEEIRAAVLDGFGVGNQFAGAVEWKRDERNRIITVAFLQTAFGWMSYDDLFIIPDQGHAILWLDHHGVVHVEFEQERTMHSFIRHMEAHGQALPAGLPDATFKQPHWMEPPEADADQVG